MKHKKGAGKGSLFAYSLKHFQEPSTQRKRQEYSSWLFLRPETEYAKIKQFKIGLMEGICLPHLKYIPGPEGFGKPTAPSWLH
jgi:hypothetical protein